MLNLARSLLWLVVPIVLGIGSFASHANASFVINAPVPQVGVIGNNYAVAPHEAFLSLVGYQSGMGGDDGINAAIAAHLGISRTTWENSLIFRGEGSNTSTETAAAHYSYSTNGTDATITWGPNKTKYIDGAQYVLVKDGSGDSSAGRPGWYLFSVGGIKGWDGRLTLQLNDFWPQQGDAISHVGIYGGSLRTTPSGGPTAIPEPGTSMLMLLGLVSLSSGVFRIRR